MNIRRMVLKKLKAELKEAERLSRGDDFYKGHVAGLTYAIETIKEYQGKFKDEDKEAKDE